MTKRDFTRKTFWRKDVGSKRTEVQFIPTTYMQFVNSGAGVITMPPGTVNIPAKELYYLLRKGGFIEITEAEWLEGEEEDGR